MYGCDVARDPVNMLAKPVPPYGRRADLVPRRQEDFGAFPEVHVAQYPISMGLREAAPGSSDVLAVTVDARGRVAFGAVVRQGENAAKIVYSSHADLVPRIAPAPDHQDADDEDEEEVEATTARTRAALQAIIDALLPAAQPASVVRPPRSRDDPTVVKYRPARQLAAFNSGAEERIVRVEHAQEDPVLPPQHRHRRVPRPAGSPPVTVMHSPPRPVSREDMSDWKIAPRVSDWKNSGGYCIPLDKRVAADDRRMQDVQISDGFASLSEALYVAEQKAREAIQTRVKVVKELKMKAKEQRGQELREIANRARADSDAAAAPPVRAVDAELSQQRIQRDMVREERRRQREREVAYDERLFNQDSGMDSGFAADDQYNVYSGRLFSVQPAALSMLYSPNKHGDSDIYGGADEQHIEKRTRTDRFRPDKVFSGAPERPVGKRDRPVEFDMPEDCGEADDPFVELDQYMAKGEGGEETLRRW
ncbi:unnamed protein product [Miscanthus lutarioriparius]|uniref:SKI-interacting protein SKIP SNW domain-containing protein n=1 Tax=Miscanthus lutarioriparius TaxID=422564 RepID=A0A811S466_9POAL|nr:unnamed protein product [Miscanthus lutarioriparius]